MAEREDAAVLLARIDDTRARLCDLMRSTDASVVIERPPSGQWSVLENVRHLLFAEQLHLGSLLPDGQVWSEVGLTPHFLAGEAAFREVGSKPTNDIDEVLEAWDTVHATTRELFSDANEEMCQALQRNLDHLLFHVGIIESLLHE